MVRAHLVVILFVATAMPANGVRVFQETANDYLNSAPGLRAERLYTEIVPGEHVDIHAGSLTVTQPIWSAPQKGDLSLSLQLVYSSNDWDARQWGADPGPDGVWGTWDDVQQHQWSRPRDGWVAPGWTLCLGKIAKVPVWQDETDWHYVDSTGATHRLYAEPSAPPEVAGDEVYVTRDSSYIKAVHDSTNDWWTVYSPDATIARLDHRVAPPDYDGYAGGGYYLTHVWDRHGNEITVTHSTQPGAYPGAMDHVDDSYGRTVYFVLYGTSDARKGRLARIDAPAFGGQRALTTIDTDIVTRNVTLESVFYGGTGLVPTELPVVSSITRPHSFVTSFVSGTSEWLSDDISGSGSGTRTLFLPTGARIDYEFGKWNHQFAQFHYAGYVDVFKNQGRGVIQVDKYANGDPSDESESNHARWVYERGPCNIDNTSCNTGLTESPYGSCWGRVDVDGPDGNTTRHQFGQGKNEEWDHSAHFITGRELSRTVYDGTCHDWDSCDGVDSCAGFEVQRTITSYERDWLESYGTTGEWNMRESGSTSWHLDGEVARSTWSSCSWNGFGDYEANTQTATGTLTHSPLTSVSKSTPDPLTWLLSPWTLDVTLQNGDARIREARFDPVGRISAARLVMDPDASAIVSCPLSATAASPYPTDLAPCLGPTPQCGALVTTTPLIQGSAWSSISSASLAQQAAPLSFASDDIRVDWTYHASGPGQGKLQRLTRSRPVGAPDTRADDLTWSFGEVATAEREGLSPSWLSRDAVVDPDSGLIAVTRDPAGVATTYDYDQLGRAIRIVPQDLAAIDIAYPTPTAVAQTVSASDGLSGEYFTSDGFGRKVAHEKVLPDGSLAFLSYEHDASSRVVRESRWAHAGTDTPFGPLPTPTSWIETSYDYVSPRTGTTVQDPLGRVRLVTDGPDLETRYSYPSAGGVRTLRAGLNDDPAAVSSSLAVANALGQLLEVTPDQPGGAAARYWYDIHGELARAELTGLADGLPFTQVRTWKRNGLGRLVSQLSPEAGLVDYSEHDVEGNVLRFRDANGAVDGYGLVSTYDAASRLLSLAREDALGTQVLSVHDYDGTHSVAPGLRDVGKLTTSTAMLPDFGGRHSLTVTHSGPGGLPSHRYVEVQLAGFGAETFGSSLTYTDRGLLDTEYYPDTRGCDPVVGKCDGFAPGNSGMDHDYVRGHAVLSTFTGDGSSAAVETWYPDGTPAVMLYGNGTRRKVERDALDRVDRISVQDAAGTVLWDSGTYEYDGLNNILSIGTTAVAGTHPQSFLHDAHGRLVSATLPGTSLAYQYDDFGNMTDRVGSPWPDASGGAFSSRTHHASGVHDNRVHDPGWLHDPSGNVLSAPPLAQAYQWDEQNRLRSVTASGAGTVGKLGYSASGRRILRMGASDGRLYVRSALEDVSVEYVRTASGWDVDREYFLGAHGEYGFALLGVGAATYGTDHLGTPRALSDASGALMSLHAYSPFGLESPAASAVPNSHRFTGQERDAATGLDYMEARYLSAALARFLTPDPVTVTPTRLVGPAQLNGYSYVGNAPLTFIDPDGRDLRLAPGTGSKAVRSYLVRTARRPSGRALLASLANNPKITVTLKAGSLNSQADMSQLYSGQSVSVTGGLYQTTCIDQTGGQTAVDGQITIDVAVVAYLEAQGDSDRGVITTVHEGDHARAAASGQDPRQGDKPTSATGPAEQRGKAVAKEKTDMSKKKAEKLVGSWLKDKK